MSANAPEQPPATGDPHPQTNRRHYVFPFGQPLHRVEQLDRSGGKEVFVLGVYSSAVHARWVGPDGRQLVNALAVASEPEIFWRGDGCAEILAGIPVPPGCGWLEPPARDRNGPSAKCLDEDILDPLHGSRLHGDRSHAWLCDLLPESRLNPGQMKAIRRAYEPRMATHDLPTPTVPIVPDWKSWRLSPERRDEITSEIRDSGASLLVLLGDLPIREYLAYYRPQRRSLREFGTTPETYGQFHELRIEGAPNLTHVVPLTHPKQIGEMGPHSVMWARLHAEWARARVGHSGVPDPTRLR